MSVYIPFLYFTLLLIAHLLNPKMRFGAGAMSLLWIDISVFFSILLDSRGLYGDWGCNDYSISFYGVLLYCFLWSVVLCPILQFDKKDISIIPTDKNKLFSFICIFFIVCVAIYIIFLGRIDFIINQLQVSRADAYDATNDNSVIYKSTNSFLLWIPKIVANSSPLLLLCWFISITIMPQVKVIRFGLLVISLYTLIVGYAGGGRAQLIWWIVVFFILFCFFLPYMSKKQIRYTLIVCSFIVSVSVFGIFLITISRFDTAFSVYVLDSFIGYAGQTLNNFCAQLDYVDFAHLYKDRVMPLTNFILTHKPYDMKEYYDFLACIYPLKVNVFFSVFGGLLMDTGILGLCIFILIYISIVKLSLPKFNQLSFCKIFLLAIIICVPVRGVFGYPFTTTDNTLYLLLIIVLYVVFKYTFKYGNKKII